jgi:hypothetical protein
VNTGYATGIRRVFLYSPDSSRGISAMSPSTPNCTHDRGRGTTVCLRCRHEQAQASSRRRQKFFMQFLGLASIVAILGVAGASAASSLRNDTSETMSEGSITVQEKRPPTAAKVSPPVTVAAPVVQQAAAPAVTIPAPDTTPAPVAPRPAARGGFVLVEGQTQLTDSIYAIRSGDSVVVNFDRFGYRTRRSDKLETSLRATLPLIYGRSATAFIDTLKPGQLVTERDVVGTLATTGMLVTLDNGSEVRVRVLTRTGRDGELAIGYLTTIAR